ncbi:MAG TPA: type II toxin-antitoxin system VapC family toxin [Thermoanaerobaculia bacterium]|nr:type II toxin-antitoxin system VapC family toxin [Thermoanaerobaculia bacterium]
MARVYLETSFVSYLTAALRESRDPIAAAHQQLTIEWWSRRRADFDLVISQIVVDEVQMGEPASAKNRLEVVANLPRLLVTDQATILARNILSKGFLPQKAFPDALHIAIATVHEIEYLLTWNCKHIANLEVLPRIANLCEDLGLMLPIICTPEELLGVANDH